MKEIIDWIDNRMYERLGVGKFYGLCKLITDGSELYPRTVATKPEKVTPNDKYSLALYHRLIDASLVENEEISFGRSRKKQNNQRIRTVVMIEEKSEVDISDVYEAIPEEIILCDYKSVWIPADMSLIVDHDAVWTQEFGEANKDKYVMKYRLYALEYTIETVKCNADVCC